MKIALATPTYAPDAARARLLCAGVDRWVSGIDEHVLIIDRRDWPVFADLVGAGRRVLVKEDILPGWLHPPPIGRRWWPSRRSWPVRGWIVQQLVKLSLAEATDADVICFADSDVAFLRPFDAGRLLQGDRVRLFAGPRSSAARTDRRHRQWYRRAMDWFDLEDPAATEHEYISQLVTWRRDTLQRLTETLTEGHGRDWRIVLARTLDFSEYILYGVFAEHRLGLDAAGHFAATDELCYCSWHQPTLDDVASVQAFIAEVPTDYAAVLVQSNLGIRPAAYQGLLDASSRPPPHDA
jgi:hypothetical protein